MKESFQALSPVKVLVIDDDEDDFLITREFIQHIPDYQFQIDWCGNYQEGARAFHEALYHIYFVDYYLGAKTGLDLLREAVQIECKEPIILLTGQGNRKIDLEAMRSGAADFLVKSELTSEKLDRCIRYSMERAATLKESRNNERKFRKIFERTKEAMFLSSDQMILQDVNQGAVELFGYTAAELNQMSLYDLMISDSNKVELPLKLNQQNEIIDFQVEFLTRDKLTKNCILSASFESDPSGKPFIQGIIRDISILKREEAIRIQSEKLEAKGMVIRTLAHEIRNPLHNITLSLGFLKSEVGDANVEFLNVIDRNSKRINDLINELMDSNQYHKLNLEVKPLQSVLQETLEKAADQIALGEIAINLNYPQKPANALVDKERLMVAFLNVIVNAIEAMPVEHGELNISISSDREYHTVVISDNGCGMSEETLEKLFEPYFTSKPKGMGLGLAATKAIIQSHKAEVEVSSELKKGTSFRFTFPAL